MYGRVCKVTEAIRRRLRFAGDCYIHKDEMASRTIVWQPAHGTAKRGRSAATYLDCLKKDADLEPEYLKSIGKDRP